MIRDKRTMVIAAASAAVMALILFTGSAMLTRSSARLNRAQALHDYLEGQRESLAVLGGRNQLFRAKRQNSKGRGVNQAANHAVTALGLKDKLSALKSPSIQASSKEEIAEARFKGLTLNELVNLLYTLDNSSFLILTRKANIRSNFENPDLLNVNLSLSLIKPE